MSLVHNDRRHVDDIEVPNDNATESNPVTPTSLNTSRSPIKNTSNEKKVSLSRRSIVVDKRFTGKTKDRIVQAILRYEVLKQQKQLSAADKPIYLNNQWLDFSVEACSWLRSGKRSGISTSAWKQVCLIFVSVYLYNAVKYYFFSSF